MHGAGSSSKPSPSTKDTQAGGEILPRKAPQSESSGGNAHSALYSNDGDSGSADSFVSMSNESSEPSAHCQDYGATKSTPGPDSDSAPTNAFGTEPNQDAKESDLPSNGTGDQVTTNLQGSDNNSVSESEQVEDSFIAKQHPFRRGTDPIATAQFEAHQRVQQQFEVFRTECENLVRRLSAATSEFIMSKVQPGSRDDSRPGPTLPHDGLDSIINIMIKTVTTTITMFVAQIEQWRDDFVKNEGKTAVTETHLEEFLSRLSNTLSQMTNLQQNHSALLKDSGSVRTQLELASLVQDRDDTIASLRAEVAQIPTLRQDYATLQRDSSTQIVEFQKRYDVLSKERDLVCKELHDSKTLIEERERMAISLSVEVEQLKLADTSKTEQLDAERQEKEKLRKDYTSVSSQNSTLQERCNIQSNEVDFLRIDLQDKVALLREQEHTIATLTTEYDMARHEDKVKAEIIATAQQHVDQLQQQLTLAKDEKADLQVQSETKLDNLRSQLAQMEHLRQNPTTATSRNNDPEKEGAILAKRRYEELKIAFEGGQSQLRAVQRFIATADVHADEAIIHELKKLNAEIQQNTTFMAEDIAEQFKQTTLTREAVKETKESASKSIGQTLADYLANMGPDEAALYLSIAFQACFSCSLCRVISSWTIEGGQNDFIDKIYEQLREAEAQPMSGRWRSLTRTYISPSWMNDSNTLTSRIIADLSDVVVVARCAASTDAASSKISSFKDKISSIISAARLLNDMIAKVVSADFIVTAPSPLELFQETTMEEDVDDYEDNKGKTSGAAAGQKVLCSTQLGMTKRVQQESGEEVLTAVKAKVVLESFLSD